MPYHILYLLNAILASPDCEWLLCLAIFYAYHDANSWLQKVSGYFALSYFMPAHANSWFFSLSVVALPYYMLYLLIMLILGSLGSKWLLCLAIFHACS